MMVADFMGHGVSAALYCMQLRSLWEDLREELTDPSRFIGAINDRLCKLVQADGYFATAAYVLLDLAEGQIHCVRAGHAAPVLLRRNGRAQHIGNPAPALGLFSAVEYAATTTPISRNDSLVMFTNGACEVMNRAEKEIGEDGFLGLLKTAISGQGEVRLNFLEEKLLQYSNELCLTDDLTMLVARRLK